MPLANLQSLSQILSSFSWLSAKLFVLITLTFPHRPSLFLLTLMSYSSLVFNLLSLIGDKTTKAGHLVIIGPATLVRWTSFLNFVPHKSIHLFCQLIQFLLIFASDSFSSCSYPTMFPYSR